MRPWPPSTRRPAKAVRGGPSIAVVFCALMMLSPARADDPPSAAAAAFDEICVRPAPGFRRSRSAMVRHGLTKRAGRGTVQHASGRMAVTLDWRRAGTGRECRVTYQAADPEAATKGIEAIVQRLFEDAWGRRRITTETGRTGTAWSVSIHGTLGEMVHMPYSGPGTQGVMIIRF